MAYPNEAPTGAQYGQRQATEESLRAVPAVGGPQDAPQTPQPGARDPMQVALESTPPTNLMRAPMAEVPMGAVTPQRGLPQGNLDALALLPLLPALSARASLPNASPTFRQWVRMLAAQIPPTARVRDAMGEG